MKNLLLIVLSLACSLTLFSRDPKPVKSLIAEGSTITKAGSGYIFTEGPSASPDGRVFFTDQPNNKIEIWNENGSITNFVTSSERANGTKFNNKGELIACADLHNRLVVFSMDGQHQTLAENFDGFALNGPNDLWITPDGGIYFSDPYYFREYWETGHKEVQKVRGVYYRNPAGKVIRVIEDYKQPNGLVGTPDGKILYVSDINDKKIWKYNINSDGTLSGKTLFAPEGSDGMSIDNQGNIYLTNSCVSVYNPKGENIARIVVPELPSNLCFGGKKKNILFITARTSVFTLRMRVKGI
ncbi:MAG TPA: SMP-30/gluconolactonase/LRE family protein [Prolixibacteraceae bacterium]